MDGYDESERLRARQADADALASAAPGISGYGPCLVAKVTTASGPAAPGYFKVEIQDVSGTETEGGAGTLTASGQFLIALNLGSAVPAAATAVIVHRVRHRWVFRYS